MTTASETEAQAFARILRPKLVGQKISSVFTDKDGEFCID